MSVVKKNIIANFVGSIWLAIMGLAFIPIYIKFLGLEAWGLIGIFSTLQIVLSLLDLGLSSTLNREMAKLSAINGTEQEINNLVRTLEIVYWCISMIVMIIVLLLSPVIAEHWIRAENISQKVISQSIMIMGIIMALQMPIGLYSGGLMGLQKHVLLNKINISIGTLRGLGSVLILWLISRTIQAFFIWQIVTSLLNFLLVYHYLWSNLPNLKIKASFKMNLLKNIWKFAAGVSGISILSVVLSQIDKIILSKIITLENFGYYVLANTIAATISKIVSPIFSSVYPKFTQLVTQNEHIDLIKFYHKICQFLSALLLPAAIIISIFSYNIILIWTQNRILAENSHVVVSILIIGSAINGLMNPPFALQLAYSWTKLAFLKNVCSILFIVPVIFYLTINYGIIGAAIAWLILNIGDFFFVIIIMHTKLLKNEKLKWYIYDVGLPFLVAISIAGLGWILMGKNFTQTMTIIYILSLTFLTYTGTFLITPTTRKLILQYYTNFKKRNDCLIEI